MSTLDQLGKGTILTEKVYNEEKIVDNYLHLDIFTGSFFTSIALSIICIVFLFNKKTEYLSWIFGLILISLTPLTWLSNFYISSNSPYKLYVSICLFCGIILNFTAILMVIIYTTKLNQRVQDYKTNLINSPGKKISNIRINENIIDNYQKIKILFTTNIVLCITIILNFFVYEGEKTKNMEIKNAQNAQNTNIKNIETPMSKHIYWWHTIVKNFIKYIDDWIIRWIHFVPIHGFLKMFLLFCIGFLFFFFSFFVKLKTTYQDSNISDPYIQNLIGAFGYGLKGVYPSNNFDIVNFPNILVETAGPVNFAGLGAFFLAFTIWIIFSFSWNLFKFCGGTFIIGRPLISAVNNIKQKFSAFDYIIILLGKLKWLFLFFLFFLPLYFIALGKKNDQSSNNITSQNFILFVLCFVLALLGTPCIFMVFELLGRICNVSLANDIFQLFTNPIQNCTENIFKWLTHYCNRSIITISLLCISFFGIIFGLFIYGGNFDGKDTGHLLSNNGNNSIIKLIIVIIMSLMVGWFFALHLKFNMFYFLYDCVMQPSRLALFTLAPIGVLALSITQVILADITSKNIGNPIQTDG